MKTGFRALCALLFFFVFAQPMLAQSIQTQYAYAIGGGSFDTGVDVGLDAGGAAYFIGTFRGTLDFDPGPGTASLSSTQEDVYIASFDDTGAFRFAFQIGNAFATSEGAGGIAVDGSGTFYVTGTQPFGTIDFDPDPVSTANRTGRFFIASYDNNGAFRFALAPTGANTTANGVGNAIALGGNVYVTGAFADTLDFNPGGAAALLGSAGNTDIFVASYTTNGAYRFAFRLGGTDADQGLGIATDGAGNVYVTGHFAGTVAFDPEDTDNNGDVEERTASGGTALFLASYTSTGAFRFAYPLGGTSGNATGYSLATDAAANVYLTGEFSGTVAFDPEDTDSNGNLEERTADGNGNALVASYTSGGVFRFVSVPTGGSSVGRDLVVNASGFSFITGTFGGTVDFDPSPDTTAFSSGEGTDVFVASYTAAGDFRGGFTFGGDGLNTGYGIAVDAGGNPVLTGTFTGTTDFDPGVDTLEHTGAGQYDSFLARYLAGDLLPVELTAFDAVTDGSDVLLHWETANEVNNAGFEVQRHIASNTWQTLAFIGGHGTTMAAQTYQHRIEALAPGSYRFRLKQIDFDGTFAFSPQLEVVVEMADAYHLSAAYPNPFRSQTTFSLSVAQGQQVRVAVYNLLGQEVAVLMDEKLMTQSTRSVVFETQELPNGVYFIRAIGKRFVATQQIVLVK